MKGLEKVKRLATLRLKLLPTRHAARLRAGLFVSGENALRHSPLSPVT
jgi:hypothetical protein